MIVQKCDGKILADVQCTEGKARREISAKLLYDRTTVRQKVLRCTGEEKGRETSFLSEWLNERKCNFAISWVSGKQSRGKFSFPGEWTGSKPQLNFACSDQVEKS